MPNAVSKALDLVLSVRIRSLHSYQSLQLPVLPGRLIDTAWWCAVYSSMKTAFWRGQSIINGASISKALETNAAGERKARKDILLLRNMTVGSPNRPR